MSNQIGLIRDDKKISSQKVVRESIVNSQWLVVKSQESIRCDRLYEGMNIIAVTGLKAIRKFTIKALVATEI
ncbi:hypothetical protein [Nostoc sp. C117]|uniref:hypothetical protein n=1 Tax=Nostoc sp. C117 TaxID=3349875 RepID=UPI00370DCBD9